MAVLVLELERKSFILVCFIALFGPVIVTAGVPQLIIDTDMDFDVDDVAAVCIANALHSKGEVDLVAIVHDLGDPQGIGAVSSIQHYYGHDDVLLGAFKGEFGLAYANKGKYVSDLVTNLPGPVTDYNQTENAVTVYRTALAGAEDSSIVISSIGFLQNLRDLLQSSADSISDLTGFELVKRKVVLIAVMGGAYPSGSEFNFNCGAGYIPGGADECQGASAAFVNKLPANVKVIFSGFEIGSKVNTGAPLNTCQPEANPCRQAFLDYVGPGNTRSSWDPLTTLMAVRGPGAVNCTVTGQGGFNDVSSSDGSNVWQSGSQSNWSYLVFEGDADAAATAAGKTLDELLCEPVSK